MHFKLNWNRCGNYRRIAEGIRGKSKSKFYGRKYCEFTRFFNSFIKLIQLFFSFSGILTKPRKRIDAVCFDRKQAKFRIDTNGAKVDGVRICQKGENSQIAKKLDRGK